MLVVELLFWVAEPTYPARDILAALIAILKSKVNILNQHDNKYEEFQNLANNLYPEEKRTP